MTEPVKTRRRRRRPLLVLAVASLLALTALEASLRWGLARDGILLGRPLPPLGAVNTPEQRDWVAAQLGRLRDGGTDDRFGGFDPELGWTHFPQRDGGICTSNSLGARGRREYAPAPAADVLRVVCYGDSFTFCADVADDGAWPRQMEGAASNLEAINMGVGGYGTDQALLRFRRRGSFGAQVVVIGIMLENIGRHLNRYRPLYYPRCSACLAKPRLRLVGGELHTVPLPFASEAAALAAIVDGSILERLAAHEHWRDAVAGGPLSGLYSVRLWRAFFLYRARAHRSLWLDETGEGRILTFAILAAFAAEAAAAGAEPVVVVFPAQDDTRALLHREDHWWQPVVADLQASGLTVVDLAEPLRALARDGRDADSLFVGGHFNAGANAAIAAHLLGWLRPRFPKLR